MTVTEEQRARLEALAASSGVPIEALIAMAEEETAHTADEVGRGASAGLDAPKLFQYHLPFLRVREVRTVWLGLDERLEGDDMLCGQFLDKYGGALVQTKSEAPPESGP